VLPVTTIQFRRQLKLSTRWPSNSMLKATRYKLHFGPYATPRFKYGQRVEDESRGEVVIVGLSNAKIPWPLGKIADSRKPGLVIYKGLAKALRLESARPSAIGGESLRRLFRSGAGCSALNVARFPARRCFAKKLFTNPTLRDFEKQGWRRLMHPRGMPRFPQPCKGNHALGM